MALPDLNLLIALDALLSEGGVARAAKRLRLSPSAASRALARLRKVTGDPLLVRAGRGLVPTPRALELREQAARLVREAEALLRPAEAVDLRRVTRRFVLRASEGFVESFGAALLERLDRDAPGLRLRFEPKPDRDSARLREGAADLEVGVVAAASGPELRAQALFRDRFVCVVRAGHPLSRGAPGLADYAAGRHVRVLRPGQESGPVDEALAAHGLERDVAVSVGGFAAALALARAGDLIATVPERHTAGLRAGSREAFHVFAPPFRTPEITVSLLWHPRMDADPAHRWLRGCVREICAREVQATPPAACS